MSMPRRFSLVRSFHAADWITVANALSGMGAIFAAMSFLQMPAESWHLLLAGVLVAFALAFDVLDGKVARWRHEAWPLGRELDSLADMISFGVAPAVIAYCSGMQGLWDRAVLLYFVACGVSRLARYNVTAEALSGDDGKVRYFEGTPITTSLLLVIVLVIAVWQGRLGDKLWAGVLTVGSWQLHPLVLLFAISGTLMISTIRIPKP